MKLDVNNQFIYLIQAIEAFHRRFCENKYMDDSIYRKEVYCKLVGAIPDEIDSDFKHSLKSRLNYGNEFSLRRRLKDILSKNQSLSSRLIKDSSEFIGNVVDTRNYLTHYDNGLLSKAISGVELYYINRRLQILMITLLLSVMGIDEGRSLQMIARCRKFYKMLQ